MNVNLDRECSENFPRKNARERRSWVRPAVVRLEAGAAENSFTAGATDGAFTTS